MAGSWHGGGAFGRLALGRLALGRGALGQLALALAGVVIGAAGAAAEVPLVSDQLFLNGAYARGSDATVRVEVPAAATGQGAGLVSRQLDLSGSYARGGTPPVVVTAPAPAPVVTGTLVSQRLARPAPTLPSRPQPVALPGGKNAPISNRLASDNLPLDGSYQRGSDARIAVAAAPAPAAPPQTLVSRGLPVEGAYARGSSENAQVAAMTPAPSPVPSLEGVSTPRNSDSGYGAYRYEGGWQDGGLYGAAAPSAGEAQSAAADSADSHGYREGFYIADSAYLLSWPENAWRIVSGPARFERQDWINTALVVGGTAALFLLDEPINDFWQDSVRGGTTDDIADFLTPIGDTDKLLLGSLGVYSLAEVLDARREKAAALMTFESVAFSALATGGLKFLVGRKRPDEASNAFDYGGIGSDINSALPSGHAATTMAAATVVSEVYGESNPWVPWIAYPTASLVALSRLNDERHWASDLFLGAAVGHFIGKMVVAHNPFLANEQLSLSPSVSPEFQGVNLSLAL